MKKAKTFLNAIASAKTFLDVIASLMLEIYLDRVNTITVTS